MTRSALRTLVIACVVLGPSELSSQGRWRSSWLDYDGQLDGKYTATCPTSAGKVVPRAGKVRFTFILSSNDAESVFRAHWYGDQSPRASSAAIAADGTARGNKFYFTAGGSINWFGMFRRGSDGSIQAEGAISPEPGDVYGCTGTWSASAAAEPPRPDQLPGPTTVSAACAEYSNRIYVLESQINSITDRYSGGGLRKQLGDLREEMQSLGNAITKQKAAQPPNDVAIRIWERERQSTFAEIKALEAAIDRIEENKREIVRLESDAVAGGCIMGVAGPPKTSADNIVDFLRLDSPEGPSPAATSIGVAGVQGSVEVETLGSRGSARNGSPIPLSEPVTLRTGPGSSVTIQVGSVRKTLQPNTVIRIMPRSNGQPDFIEQGAATVDLRKPGPSQIQTSTATVKAGGTVFTVSYDATTGVTGVTLEEGRVTVAPKNPGVRAVTLAPGEYVEVGRNAMTAVLPAPGRPDDLAINPPIYPPVTAQNIDLTGLWRDNTGGGAIYRLRQVGNWVYWLVDGTPKGSYVNLSYGQISGNTITGVWVDMPGSPTLSGGNLTLRIESNDRLVKVGASGYGAQAWIRVNSAGGNR